MYSDKYDLAIAFALQYRAATVTVPRLATVEYKRFRRLDGKHDSAKGRDVYGRAIRNDSGDRVCAATRESLRKGVVVGKEGR
jgi:hypothetical protein